jgi:hypothetical protein
MDEEFLMRGGLEEGLIGFWRRRVYNFKVWNMIGK